MSSAIEIQKKISVANKKRHDDSRKQREHSRLDKEEQEDVAAMAEGDITKYIGNIIVSLLVISLPLSEPEIDWYQVALFVGVNVIWNVAFHRHTWTHYVMFLLINMLLVQWSPYMYQVGPILSRVPPLYFVGFGIGNAVVIAAAYWFYIRRAVRKLDREERIDMAATGVIVLNLVALISCGIIPPQMLYLMFKNLLSLLTNFSVS